MWRQEFLARFCGVSFLPLHCKATGKGVPRVPPLFALPPCASLPSLPRPLSPTRHSPYPWYPCCLRVIRACSTYLCFACVPSLPCIPPIPFHSSPLLLPPHVPLFGSDLSMCRHDAFIYVPSRGSDLLRVGLRASTPSHLSRRRTPPPLPTWTIYRRRPRPRICLPAPVSPDHLPVAPSCVSICSPVASCRLSPSLLCALVHRAPPVPHRRLRLRAHHHRHSRPLLALYSFPPPSTLQSCDLPVVPALACRASPFHASLAVPRSPLRPHPRPSRPSPPSAAVSLAYPPTSLSYPPFDPPSCLATCPMMLRARSRSPCPRLHPSLCAPRVDVPSPRPLCPHPSLLSMQRGCRATPSPFLPPAPTPSISLGSPSSCPPPLPHYPARLPPSPRDPVASVAPSPCRHVAPSCTPAVAVAVAVGATTAAVAVAISVAAAPLPVPASPLGSLPLLKNVSLARGEARLAPGESECGGEAGLATGVPDYSAAKLSGDRSGSGPAGCRTDRKARNRQNFRIVYK